MTFGSREECSRVCDVVNIDMEMQHGHRRQFMLFAVPIVCEPLMCQHITFCQNKFKHLSGLTLADPSDGHERLEIDILIGSDQYWSLITGKTK